MSKVIDELRELLQIEDGAERQAAAIAWWEQLDEDGRAEVVDLVQSATAALQTMWDAMADAFGQLAKQMAEARKKLADASPELQAYMRELDKQQVKGARLVLAGNMRDVSLEVTRLEGIEGGDGLLHWVPPEAFRVTACDQITPIRTDIWDGRRISEEKALCPICWPAAEDAWWNDEYEEWYPMGDEEEE